MHIKIKITSEKTLNLSDEKMEKAILHSKEEELLNLLRVCIVGEQKLKIRKLNILVAACLILVATAATLSTIFILRDRTSAGGGDNDAPVKDLIVKSEIIASEEGESNTLSSYKSAEHNEIETLKKASTKELITLVKPFTSTIQLPSAKYIKRTKDKHEDVGPVVVVKRAEWNAENSTGPISELKILPPPYVIIAHTISQECNTTDACKSLVRSIQAYHISLGFGDIGYNFLVGGDGKAYEGLGWDMHGAHTIPFNSRSIGLAFIGNFENKEPPWKQINIALLLLEEAVRIKKLTPNYKVFGQKQVVATKSPGAKLMDIIETTWPHWAPYDPNKDD